MTNLTNKIKLKIFSAFWPFGRFFWKVIESNRWVRTILFDTANSNKFLLAHSKFETFLVSTNDKVIGRDIYVNGSFDFIKLKKTLKILGGQLDPELLIDIGANIGTICIPAIKRGLFNSGIAFEPGPLNFSLLNTNISLNSLSDKIVTHNIALGDKKDDFAELELSGFNYGDNRIRTSSSNPTKNRIVKVASKKLDDIIECVNPKTTLIWMDTQGYEGFILKGARRILEKNVPLVLEFWPYGMNISNSYVHMKNTLIDSNYKLFYNLDSDEVKSLSLSGENLDKLYNQIGENGQFVDLVIV